MAVSSSAGAGRSPGIRTNTGGSSSTTDTGGSSAAGSWGTPTSTSSASSSSSERWRRASALSWADKSEQEDIAGRGEDPSPTGNCVRRPRSRRGSAGHRRLRDAVFHLPQDAADRKAPQRERPLDPIPPDGGPALRRRLRRVRGARRRRRVEGARNAAGRGRRAQVEDRPGHGGLRRRHRRERHLERPRPDRARDRVDDGGRRRQGARRVRRGGRAAHRHAPGPREERLEPRRRASVAGAGRGAPASHRRMAQSESDGAQRHGSPIPRVRGRPRKGPGARPGQTHQHLQHALHRPLRGPVADDGRDRTEPRARRAGGRLRGTGADPDALAGGAPVSPDPGAAGAAGARRQHHARLPTRSSRSRRRSRGFPSSSTFSGRRRSPSSSRESRPSGRPSSRSSRRRRRRSRRCSASSGRR